MTLGEKIRSLRRFRGWSQENLGKMTGVNQKTISGWEYNPYMMPYGKLIEISKALDTTPIELLRGVDFE